MRNGRRIGGLKRDGKERRAHFRGRKIRLEKKTVWFYAEGIARRALLGLRLH